MKILKQFFILMVCLLLGEFISSVFHLLIPGNVIGMILLLIALLTGIVKLEDVEKAADILIKNLLLFFVSAGAGIIMYFDIISKYAVPILVSAVLSTFIVLIAAGHTTQLFISDKGKEEDKNDTGIC